MRKSLLSIRFLNWRTINEKESHYYVDYYFGKGFFDFVIGPDENTPIKPDPTTTKMALEYCGCKPNEAIYFGDSDIDMITAHNADVEAVGVTWGFRSFEQLFQCNPSVIIDEPKYISKLF